MTRESSHAKDARERRLPPCPRCGAEEGQPCRIAAVEADGRLWIRDIKRAPHRERGERRER